MRDLFEGLNPRQREAVEALDGVVMISAGAGSGKTKVLTCRIAKLIENGVPGHNILAITFTNKAAREMRSRVNAMVGVNQITVSTFHSLCGRILRSEADYLSGYDKKFTVYDTSAQESLAKQVLKQMNWKVAPAGFLAWVSKLKENGYTVSAWKGSLQNGTIIDSLKTDEPRWVQDKRTEFYESYQKLLVENNAMDFDDMLLNTVKLFKDQPAVREKYQQLFRYILVDEYQDTNHIQYVLLKALFSGNLCVVGDADQSIYGWRGADERNITDFDKDFPNGKLILLEQNYRSTKPILDIANNVISNNTNRVEKNLWTEKATGEPVEYKTFPTGEGEANFVANKVLELVRAGASYNDIAVLYRMNSQSRSFEEAFIQNGIPYMVLGGVKFYERKEIKDILAYLTIMVNPYDTVALVRALTYPSRGIGKAVFEAARAYADEHDVHIFEALSNPTELKIPKSKQIILDKFFTDIFDCIAEGSIVDIIYAVLQKFHIVERIMMDGQKKNDPQTAEDRLDNLAEFKDFAQLFMEDENMEHTLEAFLERVALFSDADTENRVEGVSMMTVHAAKGLEFTNVFLPGLENNIFPTYRSLSPENPDAPDAREQVMKKLEEERRLFYVAITRAKERLFMTNARERMFFGKRQRNDPSMFLPETELFVD